jgi:hypothetical protein
MLFVNYIAYTIQPYYYSCNKTTKFPSFRRKPKSNELPRSKLRGIGGIGTIIMPPHPALSREGRGNMVTPKRSYEESIDRKDWVPDQVRHDNP